MGLSILPRFNVGFDMGCEGGHFMVTGMEVECLATKYGMK